MMSNRLLMRTALLAGVFLAFATTAYAQRSVPELTGRVVDLADVLSPETEAYLTTLLAAHEDSTSNQVAVLTIPSLEGEAIEEFSLRTARTWGLGQESRDNGVLLTIAIEDRRLRIEVGYGLEGSLPDALAGQIIRNEITPYFRQEDYEGGILAGVHAILGAIEGSYTADEDESSGPSFVGDVIFYGMAGLFLLIFISIPLFTLATSLLRSGGDRWGPFVVFGLMLSFIVFSVFDFYGLIILGAYVGIYLLINAYMNRSEKWQKIREKMRKAKSKNKNVTVPFMGIDFKVSGRPSSGSGSSSSGSSFSGGGGSFGGGGASGGW